MLLCNADAGMVDFIFPTGIRLLLLLKEVIVLLESSGDCTSAKSESPLVTH